jgi:hypothetical protein
MSSESGLIKLGAAILLIASGGYVSKWLGSTCSACNFDIFKMQEYLTCVLAQTQCSTIAGTVYILFVAFAIVFALRGMYEVLKGGKK